jgi:hypothetical protein
MADITGRKKGVPKELAYEDMRDYIRCEMAAEFDAMTARDRLLDTSFKRQTERTSAALEHDGKSAQTGGQAAVKDSLQINGKSGRRTGQEMIEDMQVILL